MKRVSFSGDEASNDALSARIALARVEAAAGRQAASSAVAERLAKRPWLLRIRGRVEPDAQRRLDTTMPRVLESIAQRKGSAIIFDALGTVEIVPRDPTPEESAQYADWLRHHPASGAILVELPIWLEA